MRRQINVSIWNSCSGFCRHEGLLIVLADKLYRMIAGHHGFRHTAVRIDPQPCHIKNYPGPGSVFADVIGARHPSQSAPPDAGIMLPGQGGSHIAHLTWPEIPGKTLFQPAIMSLAIRSFSA